MNAREIVSLFLEAAGDNESSVGDRTGVYIFGPRLPEGGYNAKDLAQAFGDLEDAGVLPQGSALKSRYTLEQLIQSGYTFFIKHDPGNIEVFGHIPVRTTTDGKEQAMQFLGLQKADKVKYRKSPTSSDQTMNVEQTMFGSNEIEKEAQQKEKQGKEQRSVQTQNLGPIDPKEENFPNPPTGVGYSADMMPINAPVEVGFTFDLGSTEGVIIKEVHPGGPAAQAGLQAGDVIVQSGKFATPDGEPIGPFYVYNQKHLEYVLRKADPQYPIPFRVVRGDREHWLPIMPKVKEAPQAAPAQQAQPQQPQQAQPQQAAPAKKPVQQSMAKSLFAGQKPVGPRQQKLKLRPNEPSPERETGNASANVSSIT